MSAFTEKQLDASRWTYAVIALLALCASGCTIRVDSTADAPDANPGDGICARAAPPRGEDQGLCTLRAAIMEANATLVAENIEVPAGTYLITLPVNQGGGPLTISRSVSIRGAGAGSTIVDASANIYDGGDECPNTGSERRVFTVTGGNVGISYLTVRGGSAQHGGGIRQEGGELELTDATITRNIAFTGGGGVHVSRGIARIRRTSIVENCSTGAFGGGLRLSPAGQAWVYDTLIARNLSNRAGGVYNLGALNLRSTTISANIADSPEAGTGGVAQYGFAVLNNVTITGNTGHGTNRASFRGGGLSTGTGNVSVVKNSIIAGNDGGLGPHDCAGELSFDSRNNLIADSNGCEISGFLFTYLLDVDPLLAPLAFNGGPTPTHALMTGSPAREAGYGFPPPAADACELRDQRGVPRPQGSVCDLGAFEAGNANVFVASFTLVDADTDTDLFQIRNGEPLNRALLPENLSVRVSLTSNVVGSVVFALDANPTFQIENNAPYALGGDSPAGDYIPVDLSPGAHTIRATPFAGANGTGAAGGSREVQFYVFGE